MMQQLCLLNCSVFLKKYSKQNICISKVLFLFCLFETIFMKNCFVIGAYEILCYIIFEFIHCAIVAFNKPSSDM